MRQLAIALTFVVLLSPSRVVADDLSVMLNNRTQQPITSFLVSPKDKTVPGINVLAAALEPGDAAPIVIAGGSDVCLYDIEIRFADNSIKERVDMDFCNTDGFIVE